MKKSLLSALLFPISIGCLFAQNAAGETAIRQVMSHQQNAWNRGDIEAFMDGYWHSDSLKFISTRGVTQGWEPTLDSYKKGYPDRETMGTLTFTILSVEVFSAERAFVFGRWHLARAKGDVGGHFTLVWRQVAGRWVIALDHTS